jgi:lactate dehydrogenase-like 2-hydroxyacid dehydrogenase
MKILYLARPGDVNPWYQDFVTAREAGVKLWQLILEGYDHLDLGLFRANGIPVANTLGQFSGRALAEHALMLMLCTVKGFSKSQRDLKAGVFYR